MEAQDQLERKYISKKEEHRALEMQNYMGLSRNTGTFDPNRLNTLSYCLHSCSGQCPVNASCVSACITTHVGL